jgi:hypothetical protein
VYLNRRIGLWIPFALCFLAACGASPQDTLAEAEQTSMAIEGLSPFGNPPPCECDDGSNGLPERSDRILEDGILLSWSGCTRYGSYNMDPNQGQTCHV